MTELAEAQKDAILAPREEESIVQHPEYVNVHETYLADPTLHAPPIANVPEENAEYEQYELSAYRWQQNGRKIFRIPERNEVIRRQHWRCSNWDKPSKEKGCKAKYKIDIYADGKPASEPNKSHVPHNHPPPTERGRIDMETQLQMAVSPLKRELNPLTPTQKKQSSATQLLTDETILPPAKKQCVDTVAGTAARDFEQQAVAVQSVIKLFESYGSDFTRKIDLYPSIRAVFASPIGLEMLIRNGETVFISSDYITLGLSLVIFSVLADGEQAVVWLISNSRDTENYELMLRYVEEITAGHFKPSNAVVGAEDIHFREAFSRVYPECKYISKMATQVPPSDPQQLLTSSDHQQLLSPSHLTSFSTHSVITSTILSSLEQPQ